ncbi:MAG: FtsX-like permease family protein [Mycobacteriales bacterium]
MTGRSLLRMPGGLAILRATRRNVAFRSTVVGLVALTAFVLAGAPSRLDRMTDDGLRAAFAGTGQTSKGLQLETLGRIEPGPAERPLANVDERGRSDLQRVPTRLRSSLKLADVTIDSARHELTSMPGQRSVPYARFLTLRSQSGAAERISYVGGRAPAPTSDTVTVPGDRGVPVTASVVEVALSRDNARQLDLRVGESAILRPDDTEAVTRASVIGASNGSQVNRPVIVRVAGVFALTDPANPYWTFTGLPRAVEEEQGDRVLIRGFALVEPAQYADVRAAMPGLVMRYDWRYQLDETSVDGDDVTALQHDVDELSATTPSSGDAFVGRTTSRTGLLPLLDRVQGERSFGRSVLAVVLIGLLGVALTLLALVALLATEGRRRAIALIRGRGGSTGQVIAAHLVEAVLLCVPAALAGAAAAIALVPGRAGGGVSAGLLLALGFSACAALLLTAAVVPHARRDLRTLARDDLATGGLSPRRLVLEGLVVVIALAGVVTLRRRGLGGDSRAGVDVYLAAVPLLLGLAAALLTLRAYPAPVRLLSRLAAGGRGAVSFLGLSRVARAPAVTAVPLLVLLLAIALSTFASVVSHTVTTSQDRAVWREVGADYRIDAPQGDALAPRLDVSQVAGVESTARAYVDAGAAIGRSGNNDLPVVLLAIDAAPYLAVVDGTPAAVSLPRAFVDGPADAEKPLPVVLSARLSADRGLRPGDLVTLTAGGLPVPALIAATAASFPGLAADRPFALAPLTALTERAPITTTRLYVRGAAATRASLEAAVRARAPDSVVSSRSAEYATAAHAPVVAWMVGTFTGAVVLAILYATLGIIVGMTLTARSRERDLAYLRTLGLADRQATEVILAEVAPMVAVAALLGCVLGLGTAEVVMPGLGLNGITGSLESVTPSIDPGPLAIMAGLLLVVVLMAVGVASAMTRRTNISTVLRAGER